MIDKKIKKKVLIGIVLILLIFSNLIIPVKTLGTNDSINNSNNPESIKSVSDAVIINDTTINDSNVLQIESSNDSLDSINNSDPIINNSSVENLLNENMTSQEVNENFTIETVILTEPKNNESYNQSVETIMLSSETTYESSGGGGSYYMPIANITETSSNASSPGLEKNLSEKVYLSCSEQENPNNKITGNLPDYITCDLIRTLKSIENENTIEITIKSTEHINDSLKIFNEIPKIKDHSEIEILWINENETIQNPELYDSDEDGYYDIVSWDIPHLSEQIFKIIINFSESNNTIDSIGLDYLSPLNNSIMTNPINFDLKISYKNLSSLECILTIDNIPSPDTYNLEAINKTIVWPYNLPNGNHNWLLICSDTQNPQIENSTSGTFTINENFSVSLNQSFYLPEEDIEINILSKNNTSIKLYHPNNTKIYEKILNNPNNERIIIKRNNFTSPGRYIVNLTTDYFENDYSIKEDINIANINISKNKNNTIVNETISFTINYESPLDLTCYYLNFGDNNKTSECPNTKLISRTINYDYKNSGIYYPTINFISGNRNLTYSLGTINITNPYDIDKPTIYIINPLDDSIIKNSSINFIYRAEDNIDLNNCTFSLYNAIGSDWAWSYGESDLIYRKTNTTLKNNENVEINLNNLQEKNYFWEISCYDNSSNNKIREVFLTINLSDVSLSATSTTAEESINYTKYAEKSELEEIKTKLNDFLVKQESFTIDQKQALEDMGFTTEFNYYNKRLNQIDQDLGYNLKYIEDSNLREQRKTELINEMRNISNGILIDFEITNKREYVKNSLSIDLEDFIEKYSNILGYSLSKKEIKLLAEENRKIQNQIEISAKVSQLRMVYEDKTKEITLITKTINLKNQSFETLIEIIPEAIANKNNMIFFIESENINMTGAYKIDINDIKENNKLIYYIENYIDSKELENIDTLLFQETIIKNNGITGLSVLEFKISNWSYYISFFFLGVFILFFILSTIKRRKISSWKKQENVKLLFKLIKESKSLIKTKDFENLKGKYHKIKELYPTIPDSCKKYTLKNIQEIQVSIDKKDINDLVKEYLQLKKDNKTEDARKFYEKIKEVYKRLPKKQRIKIKKKLEL